MYEYDLAVYGHITVDRIIRNFKEEISLGAIANFWNALNVINTSIKRILEYMGMGDVFLWKMIISHPILPDSFLSYLILSYLILPYLILYYHI